MNKSHLLMGAAAFAVAVSVSQPVFAQETPAAAADCVDANDDGVCDSDETAGKGTDIVVTGSRIRRDEFSTAEPITVITTEEITQGGFSNSAEALQSGTVTQGSGQINNYFSGFVVDGGTGANTLGLRGLGPARTLILLNGHRLAPAGTRGSVGSTDLNVLPTAIIQQIEILKAGASSIYGSDAIAGVVNLITKKNLDGFYLEAQHSIPEIGAGRQGRYAATLGYNSGRLNLAASIEYFDRNEITLADADFTQCPTDFRRRNGGAPGSGDFIDPRTGQPKCFTLDNGGVTINTLGVATRTAQPAPGVPAGIVRFNRLRPNSAVVGGGTPGYEGVGGTGVNTNVRDTFDPRSQEEPLISPVQTWTGYFQGTYDSDVLGNAEFYVEVLANQRKSSAKLYRQLTLDYTIDLVLDDDGNPIDFGAPNPLVPAQFQTSIFALPTPTTNGKYIGARAFIGFGNTDSSQQVDFVKVGGGARGDFVFPEWRYDLYLSKTWTDGTYTTESFLTDRLAQSTDAVQNPDGTFRCRSSAPGCVPLPVLTPAVIGGQLSPEFRDWIVDPVTGNNKYRETTASFIVDGPLFTLPGGKAQIALGGEYRDQSINDRPPEDSIRGNLLNLTSSLPTVGSDNVWEVFGEINLPLLADVPFAYRLNLDASARYTHYKSYGGDVTYKVAGEWEPIRGFAFRGSYGTSYRAPALFEQFLGATSGFLSSASDPCDGYDEPGGNPIIAANCAAAGLPAGFIQTSGITVLSQGGAGSGLEAETSTNWSVGAVLKPRLGEAFGEFSLAFDYYDIKIKNGVAQAGAANILNRCYGDGTSFNINEGFCRLISRNANNQLTVFNDYVNLSTDIVRGWEINTRYARDLFGNRLILNGTLNHYTKQANKLFSDDPLDNFNGIITSPAWTANMDVSYDIGDFRLRYALEWIDGDKTKTYEYLGLDPATSQFFLEVNDYYIHTISGQFNLDNFTFTAGVRNFTDSKLPRISSGVFNLVGNAPLYSGYDYRGRTFFVSASAKF